MMRRVLVVGDPPIRGLAAFLLAMALIPGGAKACSISIQITLDFQENSAELDRDQIIKLANWLAKVKGWYSYRDADVEGSASTDAPDNRSLARRRAEAATQALRSLYEDLPIRPSANSYPPSARSQRNYAVVQLNPANSPDCSPAPITPPVDVPAGNR